MDGQFREFASQAATDVEALTDLGYDAWFRSHLEMKDTKSESPARVVGVRRNKFLVSQGDTEIMATVSGRLYHEKGGLFPVTGDWITLNDTVITGVLPRKNNLTRSAAGTRGKQGEQHGQGQVIAANLDTVFIVCGLDRDFNIRRLERCLTLVYNCGIAPAIVLTKADLHPDPELPCQEVEAVAFGVPVHLVSSTEAIGLEALVTYLAPGKTITMIGSSGAGKSTLLNRLYGRDVQSTSEVSQSVGKGRHTTTSRTLFRMPRGGMVIDNPGIREIGLWEAGEGLGAVFPEIEVLAAECRFHDCTHTHEPGCRVLTAVGAGTLEQDRLGSYHKMKRELEFAADREHKSADRMEKERWKGVSLKIKAMKKGRNRQ